MINFSQNSVFNLNKIENNKINSNIEKLLKYLREEK